MTVKRIRSPQQYVGISDDLKPDSVPEGSSFHAIDTGEEFIYLDGMWERDMRLITALQFVTE